MVKLSKFKQESYDVTLVFPDGEEWSGVYPPLDLYDMIDDADDKKTVMKKQVFKYAKIIDPDVKMSEVALFPAEIVNIIMKPVWDRMGSSSGGSDGLASESE
jgi:hypothetical protein